MYLITQTLRGSATKPSRYQSLSSTAIRSASFIKASTSRANMTTKAIVYSKPGEAGIQEVPLPKLRDDHVLVKVNAVGINPTDWKHIDFGLPGPGSRIGCDYAGVVEQVGGKVAKSFKKGDRISGVVHGG